MVEAQNDVKLIGVLTKDLEYSYSINDHIFYSSEIAVSRLSGTIDKIPIIIPADLTYVLDYTKDMTVNISGQFRSRNEVFDNKRKLRLYVFVTQIKKISPETSHTNEITLDGYVCKKPNYRETPAKKKICDLLVAYDLEANRSYYLPCICWGSVAGMARTLKVGNKISCQGRVQSRNYTKILDNLSKTLIAYEVSIDKLTII